MLIIHTVCVFLGPIKRVSYTFVQRSVHTA